MHIQGERRKNIEVARRTARVGIRAGNLVTDSTRRLFYAEKSLRPFRLALPVKASALLDPAFPQTVVMFRFQ